jgi:nucleoside-diphosphate-sugar epimerase
MRVVVVGGTGNLGSRTVAALARDDAITEVVGVSRRPPPDGTLGARWVGADVTKDDLNGVLTGADALVHVAWLLQPSRSPEVLEATNVGGTGRVLEAAGACGIATVAVASSLGVYSPAPPGTFATEEWPTEGIPTSLYSRQKVRVERMLDEFEAQNPSTRVVRLRPSLAFQRSAASEIRRFFLGPLVPARLIDPRFVPIVPDIEGLAFQAVHTDDVAEAFRLAVVGSASGPFNIASEEVLDAAALAKLFHAHPVRIPALWLRRLAEVTWRLRLQPTDPSWVDLGLEAPLLDTTRARHELAWRPRYSSSEVLLELLAGMRDRATGETPALLAAPRGRAHRG